MIKKTAALALMLATLMPLQIFGQTRNQLPEQSQAEVNRPVKFDTSEVPLRDMVAAPVAGPARGGRDFEPGRPFPVGNTNPDVKDPLEEQSIIGTNASVEPKASIGGVPVDPNRRVAPPDTTGDIGPNHYVLWVNSRYSVYTVTRGTNNEITSFTLAPNFPKQGNSIWAGFGGQCETSNDGDPLVQYDQFSGRWILTQFAVASTPYLQCVAVSTTSDPTGTYNRYAYSFGTDFNDFPKMGVWNDTYVITYNIFKRGRTFGGNRVCGYEKSKMLIGASARQICVSTSTSYHSLLPADVDGATAPPAGSATPLLSISTSTLLSWKFAVNWTAGTASLTGPATVAGVSFTRACSGGTCIPQLGTTNKLDSLADRLNYRLSYRNFGTHESMVVNHAVVANNATGIRWYELRNATGTPTVYQQGTYAPTSEYRWMGSAAMDKTGGILIGYNISSSAMNPSIRYAGRGPGDTLGSMSFEGALKTGAGSQTGTLTRWGDYSTIAVDPVDGCTMVFTTEEIPANGSFNWTTWIGSFKLSTCQ